MAKALAPKVREGEWGKGCLARNQTGGMRLMCGGLVRWGWGGWRTFKCV